MVITEMIGMFLNSRRRGTDGAKTRASAATIFHYEYNLKKFNEYLLELEQPITRYESLKRRHIVDMVEWVGKNIGEGKWSKATAIAFFKCLRVFFRWVDRDEDCQIDELKGLQKYLPIIEKVPRRVFVPQPSKMRQFKNSFPTNRVTGFRDFVASSLMLTNGMRIGELCNLKIDDMKLEEKTLIANGKTGTRLVPITVDMARLLKVWMKRRAKFKKTAGSPYVFITGKLEQMTPNTFQKSFARRRKGDDSFSGISPHTLRHIFCTLYLRAGGNMEKLRMITGHTTYEMLKDYLHLAEVGGDQMQKELEQVNPLRQVEGS
jgi:site-specific recombinase XerD